jgi:hypothetical protein
MGVPTLQLVGSAQLDSIKLSWAGSAGKGYALRWREVGASPEDWEGEMRVIGTDDGKKCDATVSDLKPSTTYIFVLSVPRDNEQGPEVAFDTKVVSCGPDAGSGTCCSVA